jgi:hypothetical protein
MMAAQDVVYSKSNAFLTTLTDNLHGRYRVAADRKERLIERNMGQVQDVSPYRLQLLYDLARRFHIVLGYGDQLM